MNIKEAEKLSGVSSRNIRFYEQKGLVKPARNTENDYREYSDEEIYRLKLIRALRMVDMPVEQIKQILDGQVSLQDAATEQRQKIKDQIKKLEAAIHFCEELSKTGQDIEEVLTQMDEPGNRKLLSKKWNFDYAQWAKKILLPLGAGLLPGVLGGVFVAFYFVLPYLPKSLGLLGALLFPALWTWFGYHSAKTKCWKLNFVLAHIVPISAYILHSFLEGNTIFDAYARPMAALHTILTGENHLIGAPSFFGLCVYAACFCLGGLLACLIKGLMDLWQHCFPEKNHKTISPAAARYLRVAAFVLPVLIALALSICGAVPKHLRPEKLEAHLQGNVGHHDGVTLELQHSDGTSREYRLDCGDGLAEIFRFDQWERAAVVSHRALGEPLCKLWVYHAALFDSGYFLEIYEEGYVRIHCREDFSRENAYYRIPPEVFEELVDYAKNDYTEDYLPHLPSGKG